MTRQTALEAFELNMQDADLLVTVAAALTNERRHRMRRELREKIGQALNLPKGRWNDLDCIESDDFFGVLKPDATIDRAGLSDMRPLLRQAIVAGCAALETYVGDRAMELVGPVLKRQPLPKRLRDVPMSLGRSLEIERTYKRRGWGRRVVVHDHVRQLASAEPSSIGQVFSLAGCDSIWKQVSGSAGKKLENRLETIVDRRNVIAHTGDRKGRGRATLTLEDARADLTHIRLVVRHLEAVTMPPTDGGGSG